MEYLDRARQQCASGDPLGAQITLEAALREHGGDPRVRLAYAAIFLQVGDWQSGLDQLEQVRSPWNPVVEAYIGGALLGLNRVSDAKDTLDCAYERAPQDAYVLLKRGELYCRLGVYSVAIDALERTLKLGAPDATTREAARRLLRFARTKHSSGFIKYIPRQLNVPRVLRRRQVLAADS